MREYSTVVATFWTGTTGKRLRAYPDAQRVAMYLLTSPHDNMIGLYPLPLMYIAHEVGISPEGALEALRRLSEEGFCTYDQDLELVWVHEMARFQIRAKLKPSDNQSKGVSNKLKDVPTCLIKLRFYERYAQVFHLPEPHDMKDLTRLSEGASEGLRSQNRAEQSTPYPGKALSDTDLSKGTTRNPTEQTDQNNRKVA